MPMQHRRTTTPNNPPTGLAQGQIAFELGNDPVTMWVGVPSSIDPSMRVQVNPGAPYLPIAGGTLDTMTGAAPTGGLSITNNSTLWASAALNLTSDNGGRALNVINSSSQDGINVAHSGTAYGLAVTASGTGAAILAASTGSAAQALYINSAASSTSAGVRIDMFNPASNARALHINNVGLGPIIYASSATVNDAFVVNGTGTLIMGPPTGPAVTGAGNINIAGDYYKNGVNVMAGAPFLPLTGGTLTPPSSMNYGSVLMVNSSSSGWGNCIALSNSGNQDPSLVLSGTGAAAHISALSSDNSTEIFRLSRDGSTILGVPTGPAVTGAGNINIAGDYYKNGVNVMAGAPFLPLTGGTLTNTLTINYPTGTQGLLVNATGAYGSLRLSSAWNACSLVFIRDSGLNPWSIATSLANADLNISPVIGVAASTDSVRITPTGGIILTGSAAAGAPTGPAVTGPGNINVAGDYYLNGISLGVPSDPDIKTDMQLAPRGALNHLKDIPVMNFRWKDNRDQRNHIGFSAVDVQRVLGEDIGCTEPGKRNYSIPELVAVLWQAVQELSAEVEVLRKIRRKPQ